jgi:nitrate/nitrite transporter NarK
MPEAKVAESKNILASVKDALGDLWKNKVTRYSAIAASFRFVAMFACDYFLPAFFLMNYPLHRKQFGILYCICVASAGLVSSISGGLLADKFGPKNPKAYSQICIWGSLLAMPCFIASVLI